MHDQVTRGSVKDLIRMFHDMHEFVIQCLVVNSIHGEPVSLLL
jgi:hypothetical protein